MSQIGYYNYYNIPHRYSPTEVVDRYQKMVDRATGDEIYANNEDPYSDRNKALRNLDEQLASTAASIRSSCRTQQEVRTYLSQKYFGTSDFAYTKKWTDPERYAMFENEYNAVCYGTIGGGNFNDPRLSGKVNLKTYEEQKTDEKAANQRIISNQINLFLQNNGICIEENQSFHLSINPYSYVVQTSGDMSEALLQKIKELLESNNDSKVDINPITEEKTGTLATYLPGVESYLTEKREAMQKEPSKEDIAEQKPTIVTLMVSECSEFHSLGEFHEGIETVDEAINLYHQIPPERMSAVRGIGINIHKEGTESYEDVEIDIISGKVADLEILDYIPDITDDPKAIEIIAELIDKLPDIEVRGSLEKWQAASLATQIDQLSYDYDTYQYRDTVENRDVQVANITEDIRYGNTGYLNDFLNAIIAESVREGITDIFGQGSEIDDSEAVQTARRAKELLDKLAEYKPLAKVEELEETNYNMIDNVLNNEKPKKEEERSLGRISIEEKLAEKKAIIVQRKKDDRLPLEKDAEKKSQREIY